MSTDPVRLSDLLTALPDDADFDAVYAELLATQRGRWFLTEYSVRNRGADRHTVVGLAAGVEEAAPQVPAAGEFGDLAAALGWIESAIASSATLGRDSFAAIERIQDIAFALRERGVDAALCDVLEAASGELAGALTRNDAAVERTQRAIALLRKLTLSINALIVRAAAAPSASAEPARSEQAAASVAERAAAETREDDQFAAAIGALAASFPPDGSAAAEAAQDDGAGAILDASAIAEASRAVEDWTVPVEVAPDQSVKDWTVPVEIASDQAVENWTVSVEVAPDRAVEPVATEPIAVEHVEVEPSLSSEAQEAQPVERDVTAPPIEDVAAVTKAATPAIAAVVSASGTELPHNDYATEAGGPEAASESPRREAILLAAPSSEPVSSKELSSQDTNQHPSQEPSGDLPASGESVSEATAGEATAGEETSGEEAASEAPAREELFGEQLLDEQAPHKTAPEELLSGQSSEDGAILPQATFGQEPLGRESPGQESPAQEAAAAIGSPSPDHTEPSAVAADHIPGNETAPDEDAARLHETADAAVMVAAHAPPAEENEIESILEPAPLNQALPDSQALSGPEEDPGDLFEPLPLPGPLLTATVAAAPTMITQQSSPPEQPAPAVSAPPAEPDRSPLEQPSPPRVAAMPVTRAVPRPATSDPRDPLAAIRALSEEELIALFS